MPTYHIRIALNGRQTATQRLIVNVFHADAAVQLAQPDWSSVATDAYNWLGTKWINCLSGGDTFDSVVVSDENYPGSTFGQGAHAVGQAGVRVLADTELDSALCQVGSLKTAVAKRYAQGHNFFPPCYTQAALAAGGIFNAGNAYYQANAALLNAFKAGFTAGTTVYTPVVYSRHQVKLGATPFTFPVTGVFLQSKQHWLRSRSTAP